MKIMITLKKRKRVLQQVQRVRLLPLKRKKIIQMTTPRVPLIKKTA
jgi:hypothetical protein